MILNFQYTECSVRDVLLKFASGHVIFLGEHMHIP